MSCTSGNNDVIGTYANTAVITGYNTLINKFYDNTVLTIGAVDVVRVVKDLLWKQNEGERVYK